MNDCPRGEIRDLLPDLVRDTLAADVRAEVERHVAICADCAAEVELLRSLRGALVARTPRVDVGKIAAAVQAAPRRQSRRTLSVGHGWRAAAAAVIIAVGALFATKDSWQPNRGHTIDVAPALPEMTFGGGVSDIDAQDLKSLIGDVDSLDAVTTTDPTPLPALPVAPDSGR